MRLGQLLPAILLALPLASQSAAQQQATLTGVVSDAVSARPLIGAIVALRAPSGARSTRTDETGAFAFARVPRGTYSLSVQRLGYEPVLRTIEVVFEDEPLLISLTRITMLDTLRVRAARQAIYGAVGTARDLKPLAHATVQVIGASGVGKITVDSTGHFFVPIRTPGAYLVRASASAYEANTVSVTVPPNDGVEVALLLDTATATSNRLEIAFADFQDRVNRRRLFAALVPRRELLRNGDTDMLTAIRSSPSFVAKNLRFSQTACVFVDGRARVGVSLQYLDPQAVEVVEVYSRSSEASGTLERSWPSGQPCGDTGMTRVASGSDIVVWVSFWLKR